MNDKNRLNSQDDNAIHISQVTDKTAKSLASANMHDDYYHNAIANAALLLCLLAHDKYSQYKYITQTGSGCLFKKGNSSVMVNEQGQLS